MNYRDLFRLYLESHGTNNSWMSKPSDDTLMITYPSPGTDEYGNHVKARQQLYLVRNDLITDGLLNCEMYSDIEKREKGWFNNTNAHVLVAYDGPNTFHIIDIKKLRDLWYDKPMLFKRSKVGNAVQWLTHPCTLDARRIEI